MNASGRAYLAGGLVFVLATVALTAVAMVCTRSQVRGWETSYESDGPAPGEFSRLRWLELNAADRAKLDGRMVEAIGYARTSGENDGHVLWIVGDPMAAGPETEVTARDALRIELPHGATTPPFGSVVRARGSLGYSGTDAPVSLVIHGMWFKAPDPSASCDHGGACSHRH